MTDQQHDQLNERLAQLAARRSANTSPAAAPGKRRRHRALASRLVAAGLSASAFLSIIGSLSARASASGGSKVAAAPPRAKTGASSARGASTKPKSKPIVKTRHHVVYVDQHGRTIPAALVPSLTSSSTPGTAAASWHPTYPASSTTAYVAPSPAPAPAAPVYVAPAPVATAPPAAVPPVTAPPATNPPPPPTTVFKPPPPPPPPSCSGTKCP
jgi:hypothetical protein